MSTDRELLELAAKAAGVTGEWCDCQDCGHGGVLTPDDNGKQWNPLADDGDALRLAVKLRLEIQRSRDGARVYAGPSNDAPYVESITPGADEFVATRRAIVRAAAELGEAMP